jgi:[FeFe] hydrogenase H-cluster maturation GTPase HydF
LKTIKLVDLGIIIIANNVFGEYEQQIINELQNYDTPFIIVHNKSDIEPLKENLKQELQQKFNVSIVDFSTITKDNFEILIQTIKQTIPESSYKMPTLVGDLINYGDIVLLIVPIDIEAPAGRLILPQIQTIRDILDNDAVAIVVKEREVDAFLRKTGIKPNLAITDSSIFLKADASVPKDIPLTGFSVVLARLKGDFAKYIEGTPQIENLKDGDTILMLESCTHHVSCEDIGRTKIPRWISNYTGKNLNFEVVSGLDQITDITKYAMVIQCGGCMITPKQLKNRLRPAINAGVPVSNYGMTIAYLQGIFNRAIEPFVKKIKTDYL